MWRTKYNDTSKNKAIWFIIILVHMLFQMFISDKRKQESKLSKVKQLGDSDSEEDAAKNWVKKQKAAAKAKEMAAKRAKMLEEMDDAFGVDDLIKKEPGLGAAAKKYTEKSLRGLKVEHDADKFVEGKSVILTLKDADVLGEDQDTLVNVNVMDQVS